jgi:membrane-bound lytic murein transglycosylase B
VPWVSSRPYTLAGDFSHNSSAKAFIKSMSRSSGMNSNYLNRLFSQARDLRKIYTPPKKNTRRYSKIGRWTRYRNFFLTPRHINGGVNFWRQNVATLNKAYQQYGVPPEYIVGILGVETIYGGNLGKTRVLDSLSTKAFRSGRRQKFFRNELRKFLLMAKSEGLNPTTLMGSSAGAIGLCQFMPSNFKPFGVDFDRSGSCNLWSPKDAIGSVANYFKKHNWRKVLQCLFEPQRQVMVIKA